MLSKLINIDGKIIVHTFMESGNMYKSLFNSAPHVFIRQCFGHSVCTTGGIKKVTVSNGLAISFVIYG